MDYSIYIVSRGETWDRVAFNTYGDAFLFDEILNENPEYSNVITFNGGEKIKVPVRQSEPIIRVTTPWSSSATIRVVTWS